MSFNPFTGKADIEGWSNSEDLSGIRLWWRMFYYKCIF